VRIEVALEPGRRAIERVVSGRRTQHATIAYERLCQPRVGTSRSSSPRDALTIHDSRPCRSALRNLDPGIAKIVFTLAWDYHTLKEPEDVERAVDADTGLLSDADPDVSRSFKRDVRHPPQAAKNWWSQRNLFLIYSAAGMLFRALQSCTAGPNQALPRFF